MSDSFFPMIGDQLCGAWLDIKSALGLLIFFWKPGLREKTPWLIPESQIGWTISMYTDFFCDFHGLFQRQGGQQPNKSPRLGSQSTSAPV
jgi:hypothetical protein